MAELERHRAGLDEGPMGGMAAIMVGDPDGSYIRISDLREALTSPEALAAVIKRRHPLIKHYKQRAAEDAGCEAALDLQALKTELLGGDDD